MDHGAQRRAPRHGGASMHIRRIEPADRAALEAFLDRIPDADRTFLKEDVADAAVVAAWARPGQARSIAIDDDTVLGYVALIPLHGWSRHVGEVRIVVDPDHRGLGVGRARAPPPPAGGPPLGGGVGLGVHPAPGGRGGGGAPPRHAVLEALALGLGKMVVEVIADQEGLIAMFRGLGFEPEALLVDHVQDRSGALRDLLVLAHSVDEQMASLQTAGIAAGL